MSHTVARKIQYTGGPDKFLVPDDKVAFSIPWPEYAPTDYTAQSKPKQVNRASHNGTYKIVDGLPQNPRGRTGMKGRGLLGHFGPNHAADPVVSRWKTLDNGERVLEVVLIKRKDCGEWAIPGGMVDAGEAVSMAAKREFGEEALDAVDADAEGKIAIEKQVDSLFKNGEELYKGYVDDPRNTDNAWMETVAMNFHDETGDVFGKFKLAAGDDAGAVAWCVVDDKLKLYASHIDYIRAAAKLRGAKLA
ncbi:ADP-ribose pyrophosphatase [Baffinella frigidus]|nr:ADP-ribose pyrophosphatase [Cryptophyta sp. CCMP2293]